MLLKQTRKVELLIWLDKCLKYQSSFELSISREHFARRLRIVLVLRKIYCFKPGPVHFMRIPNEKNSSKIRQFLAHLPGTSRGKNHVLSTPRVVCLFLFFSFLTKRIRMPIQAVRFSKLPDTILSFFTAKPRRVS